MTSMLFTGERRFFPAAAADAAVTTDDTRSTSDLKRQKDQWEATLARLACFLRSQLSFEQSRAVIFFGRVFGGVVADSARAGLSRRP